MKYPYLHTCILTHRHQNSKIRTHTVKLMKNVFWPLQNNTNAKINRLETKNSLVNQGHVSRYLAQYISRVTQLSPEGRG